MAKPSKSSTLAPADTITVAVNHIGKSNVLGRVSGGLNVVFAPPSAEFMLTKGDVVLLHNATFGPVHIRFPEGIAKIGNRPDPKATVKVEDLDVWGSTLKYSEMLMPDGSELPLVQQDAVTSEEPAPVT